MNPTYVLAAVTNVPAQKPPGQSAQNMEETAGPTNCNAQSQYAFARIRRINRIECRFPFLTDLADEIIAGCGSLITNAFAFVAVDSDAGKLHEHFRGLDTSGDRLAEDADGIYARIDDLAPVFRRVPGVDATSG